MEIPASIYEYCNYQERSQLQVRLKLAELGCHKEQIEEVLAHLIAHNFINEERFALAIAKGKFSLKDWGKIKIKQSLKRHHISEYCIQKALQGIDEEIYLDKLAILIRKYLSINLKSEKNIFRKKAKTLFYLQQKGYEKGLILQELEKQLKN